MEDRTRGRDTGQSVVDGHGHPHVRALDCATPELPRERAHGIRLAVLAHKPVDGEMTSELLSVVECPGHRFIGQHVPCVWAGVVCVTAATGTISTVAVPTDMAARRAATSPNSSLRSDGSSSPASRLPWSYIRPTRVHPRHAVARWRGPRRDDPRVSRHSRASSSRFEGPANTSSLPPRREDFPLLSAGEPAARAAALWPVRRPRVA
jgi:hypothetical protein